MSEESIELSVDQDIAKGRYSNMFVVSSNENEMTLDFIYRNYQNAILQSRIVLNPQKALELLQLLQQQFTDSESSEAKREVN